MMHFDRVEISRARCSGTTALDRADYSEEEKEGEGEMRRAAGDANRAEITLSLLSEVRYL